MSGGLKVDSVKLSALKSVKLESEPGSGRVRLALVVGMAPIAIEFLDADRAREFAQKLDFHAVRAQGPRA